MKFHQILTVITFLLSIIQVILGFTLASSGMVFYHAINGIFLGIFIIASLLFNWKFRVLRIHYLIAIILAVLNSLIFFEEITGITFINLEESLKTGLHTVLGIIIMLIALGAMVVALRTEKKKA